MGTLVKYLIYIALILAVYFIIQGLWQESQSDEVLLPQVEEVIINQANPAEQNANTTQNP